MIWYMIIYIWHDAVIDMNKRKIDYMVIDMKDCDDMIWYDLSDMLWHDWMNYMIDKWSITWNKMPWCTW